VVDQDLAVAQRVQLRVDVGLGLSEEDDIARGEPELVGDVLFGEGGEREVATRARQVEVGIDGGVPAAVDAVLTADHALCHRGHPGIGEHAAPLEIGPLQVDLGAAAHPVAQEAARGEGERIATDEGERPTIGVVAAQDVAALEIGARATDLPAGAQRQLGEQLGVALGRVGALKQLGVEAVVIVVARKPMR